MIYQTIISAWCFHIITYECVLNEYKFGRENEAKFSTPFKQCMHACGWEKLRVKNGIAHIVQVLRANVLCRYLKINGINFHFKTSYTAITSIIIILWM